VSDEEILLVYDRIHRIRGLGGKVDHEGTVNWLIALGAKEGEDMRFRKVCEKRLARLVTE
jgi:hypothetical protein